MKRGIRSLKVVKNGLVVVGLFVVMAMVFATGGQTAELTADEHTVALWHFNEGSGNIVYDESGNGNHGTIHGATWTTGMFDSALQFDGVDDYVDCGSDESLEIQEHTIEFWIKYSNTVGSWGQILAKHAPGSDRSPGIWTNMGKTSLYWRYHPGDRGATCLGPNGDNTEFKLNQWYHVAGVKSGTTLKIFINGEQKGRYSVPDPITQGGGHLYFGKTYYLPFNGTLDEVRISNVARTAEEIAESASPNRRPIADAGPDQIIFFSEGIALDGTGSYDPEGASLTYAWYEDRDKDGKLEDEEIIATEPTPTLTYTEADIGIHYYQLIVNDGEFDSRPDTVTIGVAGEERPRPNMTFGLEHMSINWEEHPRLKTHGRLGFELELPEGYDYQSMDPDAETIVTIEIPTQDGKYAVGQDRITFREYRNYWLYYLLPVHLPKPPKPHGRQ